MEKQKQRHGTAELQELEANARSSSPPNLPKIWEAVSRSSKILGLHCNVFTNPVHLDEKPAIRKFRVISRSRFCYKSKWPRYRPSAPSGVGFLCSGCSARMSERQELLVG